MTIFSTINKRRAKPQMLSEEDNNWFQLLRSDDERAMQLLFDRYYKYLVVTAYNILEDDARAKDLVQDTLFDIWTKRESLSIDYSLKAYLRRAVVNRSIDEIRSRKKMIFDEQTMHNEALPDLGGAEASLEGQDLEKLIQNSIDSLPDKCKLVFRLSRFEELSHKEIAAQLGISTKTIENQITKALRHLRQNLAKYGQVILILVLINKSKVIGEVLFSYVLMTGA